MSELGLIGEDFWGLQPREFSKLLEGHQERQTNEWFRWREMYSLMINLTPRKSKKSVKGSEVMHLPMIDKEKVKDEKEDLDFAAEVLRRNEARQKRKQAMNEAHRK